MKLDMADGSSRTGGGSPGMHNKSKKKGDQLQAQYRRWRRQQQGRTTRRMFVIVDES
ncbi:hypothetical protein J8I26_21985 [Herbaspirillum sp. LeCh32-8]|uniref:hypothetical protein n=1 Tax=Herbaspirillum sp. LeCh32-8 TaxID=2821356 RepID=UPI001AE147AA|nr:hypothetical protein [Herbaspirillum sp. LeCh32-8]MBP0600796.1 hypothetical protein [Herbaspirillum sp. LeCh32-8]